jgi:hypothetical protein
MENLEGLLETPRREAVYAHFAHRFLNQPDEQSGCSRKGSFAFRFSSREVVAVHAQEISLTE